MIYPSADTIEDMVGSRYSLVVIAAKRAKQIKEGAPVLIDTASTNPLTIALEEIAAGKVTASAPEIVPAAKPGEAAPAAKTGEAAPAAKAGEAAPAPLAGAKLNNEASTGAQTGTSDEVSTLA